MAPLPALLFCIILLPLVYSYDLPSLTRQLEQAKSYALRAQGLPSHDPDCDRLSTTAFNDVKDAQLQLSSQNWDSGKTRVAAALSSNSECLNLLKSDSSPLARALSYLLTQVDIHLESVQNELQESATPLYSGRDPSVGTNFYPGSVGDRVSTTYGVGDGGSKQGCPASAVDGTKCQYSACGKGLGLASCSIGFAKGVKGGLNGQTYTVTSDQDSPTDPAPGTLRYASNLARGTAGVWITFSRDMVIVLKDMLWVQSHTTIDGRGVNVTINGRNLVLGGVKDVIIHNIQINNIRGSDTIHIFSGSSTVWVDHVTSFAGELGLASVLQGSTDVTISNCKLQNYNFNMLLGASDADVEDKILRVTVYRNWFRDSMQRMPHCRWGICHVVNNLYTNWGYYAIGGRANARVKSESNVFIASRAPEVTPWFESKPETFDMTARIESRNDLLLNGTTFHQFLVATSDATPPYTAGSSPPIAPTSSLTSMVQQCSGALMGGYVVGCQNA